MKLLNKRVYIDFDLKFEDITELNSSFAIGRCAIAYAGRNRNKSDISKEVFEKAIKSIKNIPVVGRYIPEEDDFGGHDIEVVQGEDGLAIVNATMPFGVVPESAQCYWQDVVDSDGISKEYLFTDIILWKRQYGYECLRAKGKMNQSMEISVKDYEVDKDGYFVIKDFEFTALCIIGVEPCFEDASVQVFSNQATDTFRLQFSQMISELNELNDKKPVKGGRYCLNADRINEILAEYGLVLESLPFSVSDEMTEEDFRAKLDGVKMAVAESEPETKQKVVAFSVTYNEKREAIQTALCEKLNVWDVDEEDRLLKEVRHYLADFDDTYAYVERYTWTDGKCDQDLGRIQYSYNEETKGVEFVAEFEQMVARWLTIAENEQLEESRKELEGLKEEFGSYKDSHAATNEEFEELKNFKENYLAEQHRAAIDGVISEFEDLNGEAEFEALKERAYDYEDENDLIKECYVLRGKKVKPVTFSVKEKKPVKIPVEQEIHNNEEPYGGLFSMYKN